MTVNRTRKILATVAVLAVAGLAAACGGSSTPGAGQSTSASPSASSTALDSLARFKAAATGPEAKKLQRDVAAFVQDASRQNLGAAEADARRVASDITAWAAALRAVSVPPAYQATKAKILSGLNLMSRGVLEMANGLHNRDTAQIQKGNSEVQSAATMIRQATARVP